MSHLERGLCCALLLVVAGCAPGRFADLRDTGGASVGIGLGLSADAKLGDLTHPSLGLFGSGAMLGWESRDIEGLFYEARISEPYATFWFRRNGFSWGDALNDSGFRGSFEVRSFEVAIDAVSDGVDDQPPEDLGVVWEGEVLKGKLSAGRWLPIPGRADEASPLGAFSTISDLQVGATLLILQARLGVNPLEILDFLLGFVGLDIANDDVEP
jgi:hypothetical protein